MKKSLYAVLVMVLSSLGANAIAAKLDHGVQKVAIETQDKSDNANSTSKNGATREK